MLQKVTALLALLSTSACLRALAAVDIKLAATQAVFLDQYNVTYDNMATAENATAYVEAFDINNVHLGTYPKVDFFAAAAPAPNCVPMGPVEFRLLLGWSYREIPIAGMPAMGNFQDYMFKNGGYPAHMWTTNEQSEQIGWACVNKGPYEMISPGQPTCSAVTQKVSGTMRGTKGTLSLTYTTGIGRTLTLTTTESSSISVGSTVSVGIQFKAISAEASVTVEKTVVNEQSKGVETVISSETAQGISVEAPENSRCTLQYDANTCIYEGTTHIPFVATGWVATQKSSCSFKSYEGTTSRWLCSLQNGVRYFKFDDIIPQVRRQSMLKLQGSMRTESSGDYNSSCTPL